MTWCVYTWRRSSDFPLKILLPRCMGMVFKGDSSCEGGTQRIWGSLDCWLCVCVGVWGRDIHTDNTKSFHNVIRSNLMLQSIMT